MVSMTALALKTPASPKMGRRPKSATSSPPAPPTTAAKGNGEGGGGFGDETLGYEKCRDDRIRENMERMQKLGILDLASKFKSDIRRHRHHNLSPSSVATAAAKRPYRRRTASPSPARRSSRLQSLTPVSYIEISTKKEESSLRKKRPVFLVEGSREEIYTDEHEKLLGSCKTSWTLFVDGIGDDGRRIYDPINGKTCHQCRQKTMGHRTHCSSCNMIQGQFCGDCLYMRYGENILEVYKNPNWICPVCRGICNCSLCRTKRGWAPTGALYRKVSSLGFKSVAHYLIQTRHEGPVSDHQTSAKRSLPFTNMEEQLILGCNDNKECITNMEEQLILGCNDNKECIGQIKEQISNCPNGSYNVLQHKKQRQSEDMEGSFEHNNSNDPGNGQNLEADVNISNIALDGSRNMRKRQRKEEEASPIAEDSIAVWLSCRAGDKGSECKGEKGTQSSVEHSSNVAQGTDRKVLLPCADNMGGSGRLRRHGSSKTDSECDGEKERQSSDDYVSRTTLERNKAHGNKRNKKNEPALAVIPSPDCIVLMSSEDDDCNGVKEIWGSDDYVSNTASGSNKALGNKCNKKIELALAAIPSPDCIAGRLRSRTISIGNSDRNVETEIQSSDDSVSKTAMVSNKTVRNKHNKKMELALIVVPSSDCITGRLRSRHRSV